MVDGVFKSHAIVVVPPLLPMKTNGTGSLVCLRFFTT